MASEQTFSDWYFEFSKERNRTPSQQEIWNAALASRTRAPSAASAEAEKAAAVVSAARDWASERTINDWAEGDLMKAVATLDGDWPGCDECDHQCDEPCMPYTVAESIAHIDARLAELVREGKLYEPQEWKPISGPIASEPQPIAGSGGISSKEGV